MFVSVHVLKLVRLFIWNMFSVSLLTHYTVVWYGMVGYGMV